jgi:predicted NUDIX family phosphoesterase
MSIPGYIKNPEFIFAISNEHARSLYREGFNKAGHELEILPNFQSGIAIRQRQWLDFVNNSTRASEFAPLSSAVTFPDGKSFTKVLAAFLKYQFKNWLARCRSLYSTLVGDANYRQLLPYITIRNGDLVLPYLRGKAVGENRLAGKVSVGWGGHIDFIDWVCSAPSVIDIKAVVMKNITRELAEELRFFKVGEEDGDIPLMEAGELTHNGIINDNSDDVGRLHLGLSFDFNIKPGYSATSREAELRILPWQTRESLYAMKDVVIENWSRLYLASR